MEFHFYCVKSKNGNVWDTICRWTSFLLIVPFAFLIRKYNMSNIKHIHKGSVYFISIYTSCEILLTIFYHINGMIDASDRYIHLFFFASIFIVLAIINTLAYIANYNVNFSHSEILELQVKMSDLEKNEQMLKMSTENLEEMRRLRHDTKNQYGMMKILLQEKKYEQLEKYFEEFGDGIIEPLSFIDCDNKNLAAVLNMELSKARSVGVDFDIKIAIPKDLPYTSIELCSIFTNLIDNAIEACIRYKIEKPIIRIRVVKYQGMLYIEVGNPLPQGITEKDLKIEKTSKDDKRLHGFGNKIVDQIVLEHEGTITRGIEENNFKVCIMMSYK